MESKDIMELVDRLVLLTEENARLDERVKELECLFHEKQLDRAEMQIENPDMDIDVFDVYINGDELKRVFGWGDSYTARNLLKENGIER